MLHPNEDPSEVSHLWGQADVKDATQKKKLGRFKRMVAWVDEHWLQRFLTCKSAEQIKASDEIDDFLQEVLEEDPLDQQ